MRGFTVFRYQFRDQDNTKFAATLAFSGNPKLPEAEFRREIRLCLLSAFKDQFDADQVGVPHAFPDGGTWIDPVDRPWHEFVDVEVHPEPAPQGMVVDRRSPDMLLAELRESARLNRVFSHTPTKREAALLAAH